MHPLAQKAVRWIVAQGLTFEIPRDFSDLQRLDAMARLADEIEQQWNTARAFETRITVGNVTLFRLSIGAGDFYAEHVAPYLEPDDRWSEVVCLAWTMAGANDPKRNLLPYARRPDAIMEAVVEWRKGLSATPEELDRSVARLVRAQAVNADLARLAPSKERPVGADSGGSQIAALLAKNFGRDPDWWYWEAPDSLVDEMLTALDSYDAQTRRASSDSVVVDPSARWVRARTALGKLAAEIAEKIRARQAQKVPTAGKGAS
jgi:DNA-binding PucR family transcriptional regulator